MPEWVPDAGQYVATKYRLLLLPLPPSPSPLPLLRVKVVESEVFSSASVWGRRA